MSCCTSKKRGRSEPPAKKSEVDPEIALVGGPDDPNAAKNGPGLLSPQSNGTSQKSSGADSETGAKNQDAKDSSRRVRSSSACCAGFTNIFGKKKRSRDQSIASKSSDKKLKTNTIFKGLRDHFSNKLVKDRQFMVQLSQQGGVREHMLEYLQSYFAVKSGEYDKMERDLVSITLKKVVKQERKSIELLEHLVDQPKLKRFEQNMRFYLDRQKDEFKQIATEIIELLNTSCLPHAQNAESRAFFLNLIGDFHRYQLEQIKLDETVPFEQLPPAQKKVKRDRDYILHKTTESYFEAFKLAVTFLNPCNITRLAVTLNYTIFLNEYKKDKIRALTLCTIAQELALTRIDDHPESESAFSSEMHNLIESIQHNIEIWQEELPSPEQSIIREPTAIPPLGQAQ